MKVFQNVEDLGDLKLALEEAAAVKKDRFQYQALGRRGAIRQPCSSFSTTACAPA